MVEFVFNSDFGLRIINHATNKNSDHYLDIDLDFKKTVKILFLVLHNNKIYITVNGLSFADIIYYNVFLDSSAINSYTIEVDNDYTTP